MAVKEAQTGPERKQTGAECALRSKTGPGLCSPRFTRGHTRPRRGALGGGRCFIIKTEGNILLILKNKALKKCVQKYTKP
jgi:hypothetical protein